MADSQDEKLVELLKQNFEDQIVLIEQLYDFLTFTVKKDRIIEIIRFLYDHPDTKFQFLTTLAGIHYPATHPTPDNIGQTQSTQGQIVVKEELTHTPSGKIAVMYQLHNMYTNQRVRLKVYLPEENPVVPTLTTIFAGANWMERETYDFYGVIFEGHPDLRRILNVEEMIIFPMRKEYPLEDQTREDKSDKMFGR